MSAIIFTIFLKKYMGIFNRKKDIPVVEERSSINSVAFLGNGFQTSQAMRLSTVYCATNQISNSCALLPFDVYKINGDKKEKVVGHPLYKVLNSKPEQKLNHYEWMKMMIESVILRGDAFAYISRDERLNVTAVTYIDSNYVTPLVQPDGSVKYSVVGTNAAVDACNMIHLFQHVDESFRGISVIKYASNTLKACGNAEKHSDNFFRSGANLSGIIKASATLTNDQKKQIKESWTGAFGQASENNSASVAILPQGLEYQPISIDPEDAQLLETRKYNTLECCRFFNISPIKVFDLSNTSYSTMEQTQLSYLQDTILPYVKMIQDEFNMKLFKPSEQGKYEVIMDFAVLLETDKKTEAEYYKELINTGILSIDEVRVKLGYDALNTKASTAHWLQLNMATVDNIADGSYIKDSAQNQKVDNKVKNKE